MQQMHHFSMCWGKKYDGLLGQINEKLELVWPDARAQGGDTAHTKSSVTLKGEILLET